MKLLKATKQPAFVVLAPRIEPSVPLRNRLRPPAPVGSTRFLRPHSTSCTHGSAAPRAHDKVMVIAAKEIARLSSQHKSRAPDSPLQNPEQVRATRKFPNRSLGALQKHQTLVRPHVFRNELPTIGPLPPFGCGLIPRRAARHVDAESRSSTLITMARLSISFSTSACTPVSKRSNYTIKGHHSAILIADFPFTCARLPGLKGDRFSGRGNTDGASPAKPYTSMPLSKPPLE